MTTINNPIVEAQMMIRKPASEVFQAFIDPAITSQFWFTEGSDILQAGKTVTWKWEMYGVSAKVYVKEIIPNTKIIIEWGEPITTVEFHFESLSESSTYLIIKNYGFKQTGDELIAAIKDNTGGFTTVVDGCKAYLEHGVKLNLIKDKYPSKVIK